MSYVLWTWQGQRKDWRSRRGLVFHLFLLTSPCLIVDWIWILNILNHFDFDVIPIMFNNKSNCGRRTNTKLNLTCSHDMTMSCSYSYILATFVTDYFLVSVLLFHEPPRQQQVRDDINRLYLDS